MTSSATDCAIGGGVQTITFTSAGTATTDKGGVTTITSTAKGGMTASAPLAKQVDDLDLTITWTITVDGGTAQNAGKSINKVYVTLADPRTQSMTLYQTLLDVGCRNAVGKTTAADVIAGIWKDFQDNVATGVKRADGTAMVYWGAKSLSNPNIGFTTADLLKYADGKCGAWARFFQDSLLGQGISDGTVSTITVTNPDSKKFGTGFLVNQAVAGQGNTHTHTANDGRLFFDHIVVKIGGQMVKKHLRGATIFDPSYGSKYLPDINPPAGQDDAAELAWQHKAVYEIDVFKNKRLPDGSLDIVEVRKLTSNEGDLSVLFNP